MNPYLKLYLNYLIIVKEEEVSPSLINFFIEAKNHAS